MRLLVFISLFLILQVQGYSQSILEVDEQHKYVLEMLDIYDKYIGVLEKQAYPSQEADLKVQMMELSSAYTLLMTKGSRYQQQFATFQMFRFSTYLGEFLDGNNNAESSRAALEKAKAYLETLKKSVVYPLVFEDRSREQYQIQEKNVRLFEDKLHRLLGLNYYFNEDYALAKKQFEALAICCDLQKDEVAVFDFMRANCLVQKGEINDELLSILRKARSGLAHVDKDDYNSVSSVCTTLFLVRANFDNDNIPKELRAGLSMEILEIAEKIAYFDLDDLRKDIFEREIANQFVRPSRLFDIYEYANKAKNDEMARSALEEIENFADELPCYQLSQLSNAFAKIGNNDKSKAYFKKANKCSKGDKQESGDGAHISFHWNYLPALTPFQKYRDWGGTVFYSNGDIGMQLGIMQINQNRDFVNDVNYSNKARRIEGQYSDWDGLRINYSIGGVKYTTRGFNFGGVYLGYSEMNYLPQSVTWKLETDTMQQVSELLEASMKRYEFGTSFQVGFIAERFGMSIEQILGMHIQKFDNHSNQTAKEWIPNEMLYSRKPTTVGFLWRYNFYVGWWF